MQYTDGQVPTPSLSICHFSLEKSPLQVPKVICKKQKEIGQATEELVASFIKYFFTALSLNLASSFQ